MKPILWIVALCTAGIYICGPLVDPDLWWHITVGRWILAHHEIPTVDYWNLFGFGHPWRAYSWSSEIAFAFAERIGGMHGLLTLKLAIAIAYALSLGFCLSKISRDWFIGALLAIFTLAASYNHFTLRPQSLVWIYFIWAIYFGERIVRDGITRKSLIGLVIVFCLWANTHITTALGLVALATWIFNVLPGNQAVWPIGAAFVGTLLTPYLGGEWVTFFSKTGHPFEMRSIAEFQPATIMQYSTAFLLLGVGVLFMLVGGRSERLSAGRYIGLFGFLVAGLAVVKFLPLSAIYSSALIALLWRETAWSSERSNLVEGLRRFQSVVEWIPREGLSFLLICISVVLVYKVWLAPVSKRIVPIEAVDYIQAQKLSTPILNDFGRGGYMMYRFSDADGNLAPEYRVPIDGRTNVNPKEVWAKAHAAFQGRSNWREYIDMVKPNTILWKNESPLSSILLATGEWCRVKMTGTEKEGYSVFTRCETGRR